MMTGVEMTMKCPLCLLGGFYEKKNKKQRVDTRANGNPSVLMMRMLKGTEAIVETVCNFLNSFLGEGRRELEISLNGIEVVFLNN